jgi:hypothetical protein
MVASPAAVPAAPPSAAQEASAMACKRAKIGGQTKCIARGQFCARSYQRDYRRYGFSCSYVDRNGRYHLPRLTRSARSGIRQPPLRRR